MRQEIAFQYDVSGMSGEHGVAKANRVLLEIPHETPLSEITERGVISTVYLPFARGGRNLVGPSRRVSFVVPPLERELK